MNSEHKELDVLVVGAGFGGLHMLHRLRESGFEVAAIEAGTDVGGTWYWNRYPGARCDVESVAYSYSFSPILDAEWRWSERYAAQPEIQAYLRFAADRLELRPLISFETRLAAARFDEETQRWSVTFDDGRSWQTRYLVMATGPLSIGRVPAIEGLDTFKGSVLHSGAWPRTPISFAGKRVAVIGTGSSGTQLSPVVAQEAEHLYVLQRTPNFTVPARNRPMDDETHDRWVRDRNDIRSAMWRGEVAGAGDVFIPEELRMTRMSPAASFTPEERRDILEQRWAVGGAVLQGAFRDVMFDEDVNAEVAEFVRSKIREVVSDAETASKLCPTTYALGTKRLCVGTDYYEMFNRSNVELIDVTAHPIERMEPDGIVIDGKTIALDVLIFATGFDALTGALTAIDLRNAEGTSVSEVWNSGAKTYLGLMVAGFPNMFMIGGPGSPSVMSNVAMTNEYHVDFLGSLLEQLRDEGFARITVNSDEQDAWMAHCLDVGSRGLFANADSWYMGTNVPGKPRQILPYAGGVAAYRAKCEAVRESGYPGFEITAHPARAAA